MNNNAILVALFRDNSLLPNCIPEDMNYSFHVGRLICKAKAADYNCMSKTDITLNIVTIDSREPHRF